VRWKTSNALAGVRETACVLAVAVFACDGTEGPLIVRHDVDGSGGSEGGSGTAGAAGAAKGGSPAVFDTDVSWQVQLSGAFDASVEAFLYYVDADNLTAAEILTLKTQGCHVACYESAGTYEPWRDDAASFPEDVLGNAVAEYPNERWLDIRSSVVVSLITARIDRLKDVGCNSVVLANVPTSGEETGFSVTAAERLSYLVELSERIHERGLMAGLGTAEDRVTELSPVFDWAYAQGCWVDGQCGAYAPFVEARKAVLAVEFGDSATAASLCADVTGSGINLLVKPQDLGPNRIVCSP